MHTAPDDTRKDEPREFGALIRTLSGLPPSSLLTRPGGSVKIASEDRRLIAVFDNGVVLVSRGERWSGRVKSLLNMISRSGYTITRIVEVETSLLVDLYSRAGNETRTDANLQSGAVQRQNEIAHLIARAANLGASDIQIRVLQNDAQIRVRIHGRMVDLDFRDAQDGMALIKAAIAVASDTGTGASDLSFQQGALTGKSGLLPRNVELIRLQYSPTTGNRAALVMRLKYRGNASDTDIDALGYAPQQVRDIALMRRRTNGLYIFAGKVSSGKSTTLQRSLNRMLIEKDREITMFTIEEPVELDIPGAIQVNARQQPDGEDGFIAGMKALLRSDPNVIVLGEIRSAEIAKLAVEGVLSGHAVWSTIHAGSALGILDRLVNFGIEPWKITDPSVTRGLIYQRLCGTLCPHCRITLRQAVAQQQISRDLAELMLRLFDKDPDSLYLRGPGCEHCNKGFTGRTVVAETIEVTPQLLDLYADGQRADMRKYWLAPTDKGGLGGMPVLHHALAKVGAGICDINEVEEEVDLASTYERHFSHLLPRLRQDIQALEQIIGAGP